MINSVNGVVCMGLMNEWVKYIPGEYVIKLRPGVHIISETYVFKI